MLLQNESDKKAAYTSLKALLNTKDELEVEEPQKYTPLSIEGSVDTALVNENPSLKRLYQEAVIVQKNKKLELAQTFPDISIGYFNQSLMGVQTIDGQDVYFDKSKRFTGINVGVTIPLTFFSNAARVKALDYEQQAAQKTADNGRIQLQKELQNAFRQYNFSMAQYTYYQGTALPNAETILGTLRTAFNSGAISYVEYLQGLQTATEVQLSYLQVVDQVNQSVIQIQYLINK